MAKYPKNRSATSKRKRSGHNVKTDFSACILTREAALRDRLVDISGAYSPESGCFAVLAEKTGREFQVTACGLLLLDSLLIKHKINRSELIIVGGTAPRIINRSDISFDIAAEESCVMCCLSLGEGAKAGCRISRSSVTVSESCLDMGTITACGTKYFYSIDGQERNTP